MDLTALVIEQGSDQVWMDVIQKMESVYAELVDHQSELEAKNSELEEAQQFISSVLSAMTDVLLVCDTRGRIEQVNAALETLTAKPARDFLKRPLTDVFSADCADKAAQFAYFKKQHHSCAVSGVKDYWRGG